MNQCVEMIANITRQQETIISSTKSDLLIEKSQIDRPNINSVILQESLLVEFPIGDQTVAPVNNPAELGIVHDQIVFVAANQSGSYHRQQQPELMTMATTTATPTASLDGNSFDSHQDDLTFVNPQQIFASSNVSSSQLFAATNDYDNPDD